MSFRRMYRYLLVMGLLALAGLWTLSLWGHVGLKFSPYDEPHGPGAGPAMGVLLQRGLVELSFTPDQSDYKNTPTGFTPVYGTGRYSEWDAPDGSHAYYGYSRLDYGSWQVRWIPLWVPWLGMMGAAFVLCRWREKRSGKVEEKKLAEENAADSLQRDAS